MATRPLGDVSKYVSCIHCGMCTSSCPTYLELGSEADSPRGRIHLMRAVSEGRLELTRDVVHHLELCLDCQACVTACPSGVPYGQLIEDAKEHIERARLRPLRHRVLLRVLRDWLFPYPKRIRAAMSPLRLAAKIPGFLPLLERLPFGVGKMVQLVPPSYLQRGAASLDEEELRRQMDDGFVPAVG
ncbi:MAG: 4Fe-4S dicluster domain-containing protein, partial [Firmicutes bacterium]|nr:4Fe-4S dicluster domain-containing protein [Bacillota bacterium]